MKSRYLTFVIFVLTLSSLGFAQTETYQDEYEPSANNQPEKQFPKMNMKGHVRASNLAPNALDLPFDIDHP